ncbi:hypothetical protein BDB00DRAFT_836856 [Zychaea mexicana]|uniref:uncharacterized protein n=1 Tax=Zychaea mexicana TaxID=64656 RepID=UPI0022FE2874|nr:uncharacterized protein BDB00DRAFT_836856 [Zychaea mexicana]KAI9490672.1 hypothetical protein BDB00DRAFT_836856 [Zychaea mexicana]
METPPAKQSLTLLRIKRKRTEEPLEALLLQTQEDNKRLRKDSLKEGAGSLKVSATSLPTIFRLAETVEEKSLKNITEAQKLKERITRRVQPGSRPRTPETLEERKDRLAQQKQSNVRQARYRVINQNRDQRRSDQPPAVKNAADELLQMYEAVREDNEHAAASRSPSSKAKLFADTDDEEDDDIMCNFIPMVKEYLTLNERVREAEDEYVYDVYYRDDTQQGEIHGANVGSLVWFNDETEYMNDDTDSEPGDYGDEDSNAEDFYQNDYPDEESDEDFEDQYGYELSSDDDNYY